MTDGTYRLIRERADVVHRIYELAASGVGQQQIASLLNAEGVPTFGDSGTARRADFWQRSYVKKILENPAVVGIGVPHKREWEADTRRYRRVPQPPIPGYYPPAVADDLYDEVQAGRSARRAAARTGSAIRNPFAALGRCCSCGSSMTRITKGSRVKAGKPYLVCTRAKAGGNCTYATVPLHLLTSALQWEGRFLREVIPSNDTDVEIQIAEVARAAADALSRASNLTQALADGPSPTLSARLAEEEMAYQRLRQELELLMINVEGATPLRLRTRAERLGELLAEKDPDWAAINFCLRQCFSEVVIDPTRQVFEMRWRTGGSHAVAFGPRGVEHVKVLYWMSADRERAA